MALTVSSPRVFNGNVGKQGFVSGSTGSKCLCCPYGYHIDLDFVRYCEAVAADTSADKSTIERRKKRERRRQCQSMEILLGLVDPVLAGLESELTEIPQESVTGSGVTTLPRSSHTRPLNVQHSPALDLSDVVGDFEATLRRLSKPSKSTERRNHTEIREFSCYLSVGPKILANIAISKKFISPSQVILKYFHLLWETIS